MSTTITSQTSSFVSLLRVLPGCTEESSRMRRSPINHRSTPQMPFMLVSRIYRPVVWSDVAGDTARRVRQLQIKLVDGDTAVRFSHDDTSPSLTSFWLHFRSRLRVNSPLSWSRRLDVPILSHSVTLELLDRQGKSTTSVLVLDYISRMCRPMHVKRRQMKIRTFLIWVRNGLQSLNSRYIRIDSYNENVLWTKTLITDIDILRH